MPVNYFGKKPLLLIFPTSSIHHYSRCLVLARHLRTLFTIHFLHDDTFAKQVFCEGFETFSDKNFPIFKAFDRRRHVERSNNLEAAFLDQVQTLERMQPALVIGDGLPTLSMACEYTGVPYISLINGHQSPYYVQGPTVDEGTAAHQPYQLLREQYGLQEKYSCRDELTGDLNWICNLPDSYPQKELPYHYEVIGPLYEVPKITNRALPTLTRTYKKTIYIDIETISDQQKELAFLHHSHFKKYTIIYSKKCRQQITLFSGTILPSYSIDESLIRADLVICDTEAMVYKALHLGIPALLIRKNQHTVCTAAMLTELNLGEAFTEQQGSREKADQIAYWVEQKNKESFRDLQYKLTSSISMLSSKLVHSLKIHFPFVERERSFH